MTHRIRRARCLSSAALIVIALAGASLGCAGRAPRAAAPVAQPQVRHGLCFVPRDPNAALLPVRPQDWLKLLVKLELGHDAIVALRDCTGRVIAQTRGGTCRQTSEPNELPAPMPIRRASVIERSLDGNRQLLWVISHRLPNGDGFGPLAITRRVADGLEVEALGNLSMRTERVKLELWNVQNEAVVMASGEVCQAARGSAADGGERPACRRAVRLFVARQGALLEAPLLDPTGHCLQPTPIELDQRQQQPLSAGLKRSFELSSAIGHDAKQIVLEERLVVRDSDPNLPLSAAREVQRVEATRFIRVQAGRLFSQQRPLWSQVLSKLLGPHNQQPNANSRAMSER